MTEKFKEKIEFNLECQKTLNTRYLNIKLTKLILKNDKKGSY